MPITGFIGLAYEGISSFLCNGRHKALHKAVKATETKSHIKCNKPIHLEDSTVMYRVYSAKTLEKLIKTVHGIHLRQTVHNKYLQDDLLQHINCILIHRVTGEYNIML